MQFLNPVETTLTIAGKQTHFVHITLHQSFNAHHQIKLDDTKGSETIRIFDINGNIVEIDTPANNISISANATIYMTATDIVMSAKTQSQPILVELLLQLQDYQPRLGVV